MQIIVNADDLGYTRGVTEGIIEAYQKGIVTSATVMCNMPNAVYAARRINEVPGLGLGVHLNLTCGKPLTQPHTLVQPDGTFLKNRVFYKVFVDPGEVEAEFAAQIERFCDLFGRLPTHLDCHQGCYDGQTLTMAEVGGIAPEHPTEEILRRTKRLAEKWGLPLRRHCDFQWLDGYHGDQATPQHFLQMLQDQPPQARLEFMVHPGWCDLELFQRSSYHFPRVKELAGLCDPQLAQALRDRGVELVHF